LDLNLAVAASTTEEDYAKKQAFAIAYFEHGNVAKAAAIAGVHYNTGNRWKGMKWFEQATKDLKKAKDRLLDGKITKILDKALERLEDRIENGDTKAFANKDGVIMKQVPVSARDLAVVTGVLFDKRAAIRKEPDSDDSASSALDRIAEKLREYARAENPAAPVKDITDVEVHEVDEDPLC
jgi:hypothetical protein